MNEIRVCPFCGKRYSGLAATCGCSGEGDTSASERDEYLVWASKPLSEVRRGEAGAPWLNLLLDRLVWVGLLFRVAWVQKVCALLLIFTGVMLVVVYEIGVAIQRHKVVQKEAAVLATLVDAFDTLDIRFDGKSSNSLNEEKLFQIYTKFRSIAYRRLKYLDAPRDQIVLHLKKAYNLYTKAILFDNLVAGRYGGRRHLVSKKLRFIKIDNEATLSYLGLPAKLLRSNNGKQGIYWEDGIAYYLHEARSNIDEAKSILQKAR